MRKFYLKYQVRFALAGALFGLLFPLAGLLFEHFIMGLVFTSPIDLIRSNPIHGIVALAPLVLGLMCWHMGYYYASVHKQMLRARAAEKHLWHLANRDSLTDRGNRHSLREDIDVLIGSRDDIHLLLLDLDRFKMINDTLGHHVGDEVLKGLASRLDETVLQGAKLYRLGGDEFVVLAERCDVNAAKALADRILKRIEEPFHVCGTNAVIGCSIGMTAMTEADFGMGEILVRADLALYQAKASFGNNAVYYAPEMSDLARARLSMEQDIRRGLNNDEFFVEFQPIINLEANRVRGFEALARWQHPELGTIPPLDFIPIAEVSGLIISLGERVLNLACEEAVKWPAPISISVNVSIEQFLYRQFHDQVMAALDRHGLPPGRLILEITETIFTLDIEAVAQVFRRLKMIGVRFALDDFGTGYSSINHLRQLDLDYLKLDKSFADSIGTESRDSDLVQTMIELGNQFHLTTTMEGVETQEQLDFMRRNGVDEVQGYLFSRPLAATDVPDFLERNADEVTRRRGPRAA